MNRWKFMRVQVLYFATLWIDILLVHSTFFTRVCKKNPEWNYDLIPKFWDRTLWVIMNKQKILDFSPIWTKVLWTSLQWHWYKHLPEIRENGDYFYTLCCYMRLWYFFVLQQKDTLIKNSCLEYLKHARQLVADGQTDL